MLAPVLAALVPLVRQADGRAAPRQNGGSGTGARRRGPPFMRVVRAGAGRLTRRCACIELLSGGMVVAGESAHHKIWYAVVGRKAFGCGAPRPGADSVQ